MHQGLLSSFLNSFVYARLETQDQLGSTLKMRCDSNLLQLLFLPFFLPVFLLVLSLYTRSRRIAAYARLGLNWAAVEGKGWTEPFPVIIFFPSFPYLSFFFASSFTLRTALGSPRMRGCGPTGQQPKEGGWHRRWRLRAPLVNITALLLAHLSSTRNIEIQIQKYEHVFDQMRNRLWIFCTQCAFWSLLNEQDLQDHLDHLDNFSLEAFTLNHIFIKTSKS